MLGAIMIRNSEIDVAMTILHTDDFFLPAHREIWDAMVDLTKEGSPVDGILLSYVLQTRDVLRRLDGGDLYILGLSNAVPTAENTSHYAKLVRRLSVGRRLLTACAEAMARLYAAEDIDEIVEEHRLTVAALDTDVDDKPRLIEEDIEHALKVMEDKGRHPEKHFVRTGHPGFDRKIGGHGKGQLIVVAARPGDGKSSWGMNCAIRSSQMEIPNLIISLEMPRQELIERGVGFLGEIETRRIHRGTSDPMDWRRIDVGSKKLRQIPLYLYDRPIGLQRILSISRRWRALHRGKLVQITVDYLQIFKRQAQKGRSTEDILSEMTRELKLLAKELECPVVVISQLNRENEKDKKAGKRKRPEPHHLRGSGSIEQDADMIVFPLPEEPELPTDHEVDAELIVAKHRGGPTGIVRSRWNRLLMGFYDHPDNAIEPDRRFVD